MPRYRISLDSGLDCTCECISDREAIEYAAEILADDGAEPGEEASVYLLGEARGAEDYVGAAVVPGDDA